LGRARRKSKIPLNDRVRDSTSEGEIPQPTNTLYMGCRPIRPSMIVSGELETAVEEWAACGEAAAAGAEFCPGNREAAAVPSKAEQKAMRKIRPIANLAKNFLNLSIGFKRVRLSHIVVQVLIIKLAYRAFYIQTPAACQPTPVHVNRHIFGFLEPLFNPLPENIAAAEQRDSDCEIQGCNSDQKRIITVGKIG